MDLSFELPLNAGELVRLLEEDPIKILELRDYWNEMAALFRADVDSGHPEDATWPDVKFWRVSNALTSWADYLRFDGGGVFDELGRAVMAWQKPGRAPWGNPPDLANFQRLIVRAHALRDRVTDDAEIRLERRRMGNPPADLADTKKISRENISLIADNIGEKVQKTVESLREPTFPAAPAATPPTGEYDETKLSNAIMATSSLVALYQIQYFYPSVFDEAEANSISEKLLCHVYNVFNPENLEKFESWINGPELSHLREDQKIELTYYGLLSTHPALSDAGTNEDKMKAGIGEVIQRSETHASSGILQIRRELAEKISLDCKIPSPPDDPTFQEPLRFLLLLRQYWTLCRIFLQDMSTAEVGFMPHPLLPHLLSLQERVHICLDRISGLISTDNVREDFDILMETALSSEPDALDAGPEWANDKIISIERFLHECRSTLGSKHYQLTTIEESYLTDMRANLLEVKKMAHADFEKKYLGSEKKQMAAENPSDDDVAVFNSSPVQDKEDIINEPIKLVVELDLACYTDAARLLQQSFGALAVKTLNQQIRGFVQGGLEKIGRSLDNTPYKGTGDGAIVILDTAKDAVLFAKEIHIAASTHNDGKDIPAAQRHFRIGITKGEVVIDAERTKSGELKNIELHGSTIGDAVRLEAGCLPGEILVCEKTFADLPGEMQTEFGPGELVKGKTEKEKFYNCHRLKVVETASRDHGPSARPPDVIKRINDYMASDDMDLLAAWVEEETRKVTQVLCNDSIVPDAPHEPLKLHSLLMKYEKLMHPLLLILIEGCPRSKQFQEPIWTRCIETLVNLKDDYGAHDPDIRFYPVLLLLYAGGISSVAEDKYQAIASLYIKPSIFKSRMGHPQRMLGQYLYSGRILEKETVALIPGFEKFPMPLNQYLMEVLYEHLKHKFNSQDDFIECFDRFEYLLALVHADIIQRIGDLFGNKRDFWYPPGMYLFRNKPPMFSLRDEFNKIAASQRGKSLLEPGLFGGNKDRLIEVNSAFTDDFIFRMMESIA